MNPHVSTAQKALHHFSVWIMFSRVLAWATLWGKQDLAATFSPVTPEKSSQKALRGGTTLLHLTGQRSASSITSLQNKEHKVLRLSFNGLYVYKKWCCQNVVPIHSIIFFDLSFSVSIQWLPQSWFLVRRDKLMKQHLNHRIPSLNCIMSSQQWGMCLSLQTGRSLKTHYAVLEKKFKLRHKTNLCWSVKWAAVVFEDHDNHDNYFCGTRWNTNGFNKPGCDLRAAGWTWC